MRDLSVMPTGPASVMVVDDQTAARRGQFPKLTQQDALSRLGGTMGVAIRLKPIVWVNEYETGFTSWQRP